MKSNLQKMSALTLAMGTALALSAGASATDNPFAIKPIGSGHVQLADADGKCGANKSEGKCGANKSAGEGKCGGNKTKSISVLEGKCGNGKCGTMRIRQMMDENGDGRIQRSEYTGWAARQAGAEFDQMSHGQETVTPDDAFQNFLRWESYSQQG